MGTLDFIKSRNMWGGERMALRVEAIAHSKCWRCENVTYLRMKNHDTMSPVHSMCVVSVSSTDVIPMSRTRVFSEEE